MIVANQSVINRISKVADDAIDKVIPCKDSRPIVLTSVGPKPPGIKDTAPMIDAVV